ncbi:MAG: BtrH N-terminal domain-containing protein [Chloroflexota bacterium]
MSIPQPIFEKMETHHCVSGSMRRLYGYNQHRISEEMLFGLGEGTGYIYWHQKGQAPIIGGRSNPNPSVEELAAQRTGVQITPHTTTSVRKAEATLLNLLESGTPVMLQVDMGFLPYMDFGGQDYHFGGHVIVAYEYDNTTRSVLVADRDLNLHQVSLEALAQARGSKHKPFPPKNKWWTFDFSEKREPTSEEIGTAIRNQATLMLEPPISNIGIKGIRKTAKLIPQWSKTLEENELRHALFDAYIFISPVGGTGGGTFRYMFSRFLAEAADHTGNSDFLAMSASFEAIGDQWATLGEWFKEVADNEAPAKRLPEVVAPLNRIATLEEQAWKALLETS